MTVTIQQINDLETRITTMEGQAEVAKADKARCLEALAELGFKPDDSDTPVSKQLNVQLQSYEADIETAWVVAQQGVAELEEAIELPTA